MIKQIDDNLYGVICGWWAARGWPVLPKESLPKTGYIAFIEEKPIAAGFILKFEEIPIGMLEWIVSDPDTSHKERSEAISELMDHMISESKNIGIRILGASISNMRLKEKYLQKGFLVSDEAVSLLVRMEG